MSPLTFIHAVMRLSWTSSHYRSFSSFFHIWPGEQLGVRCLAQGHLNSLNSNHQPCASQRTFSNLCTTTTPLTSVRTTQTVSVQTLKGSITCIVFLVYRLFC
uniref:Uncharacterized protein n=1 Tax=Gasterosteus aculeatus TaxID=69293 RepID=G3N6S8_GASAC